MMKLILVSIACIINLSSGKQPNLPSYIIHRNGRATLVVMEKKNGQTSSFQKANVGQLSSQHNSMNTIQQSSHNTPIIKEVKQPEKQYPHFIFNTIYRQSDESYKPLISRFKHLQASRDGVKKGQNQSGASNNKSVIRRVQQMDSPRRRIRKVHQSATIYSKPKMNASQQQLRASYNKLMNRRGKQMNALRGEIGLFQQQPVAPHKKQLVRRVQELNSLRSRVRKFQESATINNKLKINTIHGQFGASYIKPRFGRVQQSDARGELRPVQQQSGASYNRPVIKRIYQRYASGGVRRDRKQPVTLYSASKVKMNQQLSGVSNNKPRIIRGQELNALRGVIRRMQQLAILHSDPSVSKIKLSGASYSKPMIRRIQQLDVPRDRLRRVQQPTKLYPESKSNTIQPHSDSSHNIPMTNKFKQSDESQHTVVSNNEPLVRSSGDVKTVQQSVTIYPEPKNNINTIQQQSGESYSKPSTKGVQQSATLYSKFKVNSTQQKSGASYNKPMTRRVHHWDATRDGVRRDQQPVTICPENKLIALQQSGASHGEPAVETVQPSTTHYHKLMINTIPQESEAPHNEQSVIQQPMPSNIPSTIIQLPFAQYNEPSILNMIDQVPTVKYFASSMLNTGNQLLEQYNDQIVFRKINQLPRPQYNEPRMFSAVNQLSREQYIAPNRLNIVHKLSGEQYNELSMPILINQLPNVQYNEPSMRTTFIEPSGTHHNVPMINTIEQSRSFHNEPMTGRTQLPIHIRSMVMVDIDPVEQIEYGNIGGYTSGLV